MFHSNRAYTPHDRRGPLALSTAHKAVSVHQRGVLRVFPVLSQYSVAFGSRPYLGTRHLDTFLPRTGQIWAKGGVDTLACAVPTDGRLHIEDTGMGFAL